MSQSKGTQFNWPAGANFIVRKVYTQSGAGGGNVVIKISPKQGTEFILMTAAIGPDDYAANRSVRFSIQDEDGNGQALFFKSAAIDNMNLHLPGPGSAIASDNFTEFLSPILIAGDTVINLTAVALVQNETFTIALRLRLKDQVPDISSAGSGGTVAAPTTTVEKVL